jgi:hypothetical protein
MDGWMDGINNQAHTDFALCLLTKSGGHQHSGRGGTHKEKTLFVLFPTIMTTPSAVAVQEEPNVVKLKEWDESVTKAKFDAARERYAAIWMMMTLLY